MIKMVPFANGKSPIMGPISEMGVADSMGHRVMNQMHLLNLFVIKGDLNKS